MATKKTTAAAVTTGTIVRIAPADDGSGFFLNAGLGSSLENVAYVVLATEADSFVKAGKVVTWQRPTGRGTVAGATGALAHLTGQSFTVAPRGEERESAVAILRRVAVALGVTLAPEGSKVGGPAPKAAPVAAPALTAAFAATAPAPAATKARRGMGSGAVNDAKHGPVTTRTAAPAPEAPAPDLAAIVAQAVAAAMAGYAAR